MTIEANSIPAEILAFINAWNENLRAELSGQPAASESDLFKRYPKLLTIDLLSHAHTEWKNRKDRAASESLGFLFQHRVCAEAGMGAMSNIERLRFCDELSSRLVGTSYWSLAHSLHLLDPKRTRQLAVDVLNFTEEAYAEVCANLRQWNRPSVVVLQRELHTNITLTAHAFGSNRIWALTDEILEAYVKYSPPVEFMAPVASVPSVVLRFPARAIVCSDVRAGREDLRARLHALGHALDFALTESLPSFCHLFSLVPTETIAFLFQWLTCDRSVVPEEAGAAWERFLFVYLLRRQATLCLYLDTLASRDWEPDEKLYRELMYTYVATDFPTARARTDLESRLLPLQFLHAADLALKLRHNLEKCHGQSWWRRPDAADMLVPLLRGGTQNRAQIIQEFAFCNPISCLWFVAESEHP